VLVVGAMALLMLGVFGRRTIARPRPSAGSPSSSSALAAWLVFEQPGARQTLFDGGFVPRRLGRYMKVLTLVASAGALLLSFD